MFLGDGSVVLPAEPLFLFLLEPLQGRLFPNGQFLSSEHLSVDIGRLFAIHVSGCRAVGGGAFQGDRLTDRQPVFGWVRLVVK